MPDNRSEMTTQQEVKTAIGAKDYLRKLFPWIAAALVVSANFVAAYRIDQEVMAGKFSGSPYLALIVLFVSIFVIYHYLSSQEK